MSQNRSMVALAAPAVVLAMIVVLGLLVATSAVVAIGFVVVGLVMALAFVAPAANLTLIVLTTAVIPFSIQNQITGGGRGAILSDLFLFAGLLRVAPGLMAHARLDRRHQRLLVPVTVFLVMALAQFGRGLASGNDPSLAGAELRTLLGFGTFLIAAPLIAHRASRDRLITGLLITGLILGLWGMAQWFLDIRFAGEFGVREGINFTTSGRGQLQGGLYAFPVATVLGFTALIARVARERRHLMLLATVTVLNG